MFVWPMSSPKMTRMFGFVVFGCWARAGCGMSGERLVATSAVANKVRNKALVLGADVTALFSTLPMLS